MRGLQTLVMPSKCTRCGELFDLSYDLETANSGDFGRDPNVFSLPKKKSHLCWVCRLRRK